MGRAYEYSIEDLKQYASSKGGECVSNEYCGCNEEYLWRCSCGNEWITRWRTVKRGAWCPECAKLRMSTAVFKYSIDDLNVYAESKGGRCVSNYYSGYDNDYLWECKCGNRWKATWHNVLGHDSWCPKCSTRKVSIGNRCYCIEDLRRYAGDLGGFCFSKEYISGTHKYRWCCEFGHEWVASWHNILYNNTWCRKCSMDKFKKVNFKYCIGDLKEHATSLGGECLSDVYCTCENKYRWACKYGHTWDARWSDVLNNGSLCPYCRFDSLGESVTRDIFEKIFGVSFNRSRPSWLVSSSGNRLELDGYNYDLGIAFEYNGIQHYEPVKFFGGEDAYRRRIGRDVEKVSICKCNGVELIVLECVLPDDIFSIVCEKLVLAGYNIPIIDYVYDRNIYI